MFEITPPDPKPLPKYRSHKIVQAAKIQAIDWTDYSGDAVLNLGEHGKVQVTRQWLKEKHAQAGGYYVVYEGGYSSFSPAPAFEAGYTRVDG